MKRKEMTRTAFEKRFTNRTTIGLGGFAKVLKAFDNIKKYYVAIKVSDVREDWKKFTLQREVELVNALPLHKNIARYEDCYRFDMGLAGLMDFAILKFYESGNLAQFLAKEQVSPEDKKLIIQGILEGVAFLHQKNMIHRDLKSQNILLSREDGVWTPKITDFGLSRQGGGNATLTNSAIGMSYAYAAPEQIKNQKINKNVDLWAVGVVIYHIVAGELPFKITNEDEVNSTKSQMELCSKITNLELPDKLATLSEPYQKMIRQCLVLEPRDRVQTAAELLNLLNGEENSTAIPTSSTEYLNPSDDDFSEGLPPGAGAQNTNVPESETKKIGEQEDLPSLTDQYNPRSNPTQYIPQEESFTPLPTPQPIRSGDFTPRFNWLWIIIPSILMVGIGGIFWTTRNPDNPTQSPPPPVPEKHIVPTSFLDCFEEGKNFMKGTPYRLVRVSKMQGF